MNMLEFFHWFCVGWAVTDIITKVIKILKEVLHV